MIWVYRIMQAGCLRSQGVRIYEINTILSARGGLQDRYS